MIIDILRDVFAIIGMITVIKYMYKVITSKEENHIPYVPPPYNPDYVAGVIDAYAFE